MTLLDHIQIKSNTQAQTLTVWRQADGHNEETNAKIPRIIFVNKMDKANCNLHKTINSIENKLGCDPIITQVRANVESKTIHTWILTCLFADPFGRGW